MLTIYKASAGSGKTYNLALEYIRLLLGLKMRQEGNGRYVLNSDRYAPGGRRLSNRHRNILAITFTNAATDEMKRRIIRELKLLADLSPEAAYTARLTDAFGCTDKELAKAARTALGELLYDYGGFNVSTIDSFFQTVLRTFSREVDHQGDYELTLNEDEAVRQSISEMLDELNYMPHKASQPLLEWVKTFTMGQMQEGKGYNFFQRDGLILSRLARFITSAMDEIYRKYADRIEEYLADEKRVDLFESELRQRVAQFADEARDAAARFFEAVSDSELNEGLFNATLVRFTRDIKNNPGKIDSTRLEGSTVRMCLEPDSSFPEKKLIAVSKFTTKAMKATIPSYIAVGQQMRRAIALYLQAADIAATDRIVLQSTGQLRFMGYALRHLRDFLRDNNLVMISDTGELIKRIIKDAEMPFIYERLGMRLTNLLIDEFQDTSRMQWHNLRPLIANSLDDRHDNLIIGDEKQAIYRFRNSDSELLGHIVAETFPDRHKLRGDLPADNTNHRSSELVVKFNNSLFRNMSAIIDTDGYGNVVQTPGRHTSGYVRLMMHSKGKVETETILADMAQQMLRQHQAGYKWRDILVLVRFRREAVAIVNYLTAFYPSIRILSDEALLLNNSEAVRTVMSMVRMVHRSYNEALTAADADNARYGSADDIELMETRFNYYLANGSDVAQALELALRGADDAPGPVDEVASIRSRNPANLVALIESVIALKLTPEQRESEYAYLAALQDLAVKHCEGSDPSVRAFLEAYDRNIHKWAIKAPSDIDAVQIMTIHKSKGLERACVHIPMAGWNIFARNKIDMWLPLDHGYRDMLPDCVPPALYMSVPVSSGLMSDPGPYGQYCRERFNENIIDSLNLCYVAFTRAARELNVYFSAGSSEATEMGYYIQRALRSETGGEPEASTMDLRLGLQSEKDACYADFNDIYIYGSPTVPEKKEPEPDSPVNGAGHYPVVFRDDTRELTSIDNDLFATRTDEFGDEDYKEITDPAAPFTASPEMEAAARRGNHLHSILGDMRTLDDLDRALERAAVRFGLDPDERSDYRRLITEAFRSAGVEASRWFDPGNKVFAERSIYISATDESFRPDRVVLTPDGRTVVVDYKFTSRTREAHRRQMEIYLSLLSRLGHEDIEGYIWYPLLEKIIPVV